MPSSDEADRELDAIADLRARLFEEMIARLPAADASVPIVDGGWEYLYRTERDRPYPVYVRRPAGAGPESESVYFDPHRLAAEVGDFDIGAFALSPDHTRLAVSYDADGDEEYTLTFVDCETGEVSGERVPGTFGSVAWTDEGAAILYARLDGSGRPAAIARHVLGQDPSRDVVVFAEDDPSFQVSVVASKSRRVVFVTVESHTTTEVWWAPAGGDGSEFRVVRARQPGVVYDAEDRGDGLVVTIAGAVYEVAGDEWRPLPPSGIEVDFVDVFADHYVLHGRAGGLDALAIVDRRSSEVRRVRFDAAAYSLAPLPAPDLHAPAVSVVYSTLAAPPAVLAVGLRDGRAAVVKEAEVGGIDPSLYTVARAHAVAADGVEVPVSLAYRIDSLAGDGTNPCLLEVYGAYGETLDPGFAPERVSLLDRGFVVAIAHVRGGGELGQAWHDAGRRERKPVAIDDYLACVDHLVAAGYTSAGRVVASGVSAGGLVAAAAVNRRPDLFGALVAHAPFLDPVGTLLDAGGDLDEAEWEEWGDPADPAERVRLRSYAPIDNVGARPYPPMLLVAAEHDARVPAAQALAFAERVRQRSTRGAPCIVVVGEGGHAGGSGRLASVDRQALIAAFLLGTARLAPP